MIYLFLLILISVTGLRSQNTFKNPVGEGADPFVVYAGGNYYMTQTTGRTVKIWKSAKLQEVGLSTPSTIFTPPEVTSYSKEIWAPEIFFLHGKWYVYFCADDGVDENHRIYVLEGGNDPNDPLNGSYTFKGRVGPDEWSIDPGILELNNKLYLMFSGRGSTGNSLKFIELSNPFTNVGGESYFIALPRYAWEKMYGGVNEGPEVLIKNGRTMIIYSASHAKFPDYCLVMLTYKGGNVLDSTSWEKHPTPVFSKTDKTFGPGHNVFVKSPDGTEDWIYYHAKKYNNESWARELRMQKFVWNKDNTPKFGAPIDAGVELKEPSSSNRTSTFSKSTDKKKDKAEH